MPDVDNLNSDQEILDVLGKAYAQIVAKLDAEIKKQQNLEKHLADTKSSILKQQQARKDQTIRLEKTVQNLANIAAPERFNLDEKGHAQRKEELLEKLKLMQDRETKANERREILLKDEEQFYAANLHASTPSSMDEKNKLMEEITVLEMQINHLLAEKERVTFQRSVVATDEMRNSHLRSGVQQYKQSLASKVKQLHKKTDKREQHYWQLLAQQQEVASQIQQVDREMEEIRIANSKMQIATEHMEVLVVGLDQQQSINSILQEKLLRIRAALDQHMESQAAAGLLDAQKSDERVLL